jgi:hypothetical protein
MSVRYRTRTFLYCNAVAVFAVCLDAVVAKGLLLSGVGVARAVANDLFMGTAKEGEPHACGNIGEDSRVTFCSARPSFC